MADAPIAFLHDDVPCRNCSYNLRGLPTAGHCPECGAAVALSLHDDRLCYSSPEYVGRLALGVRLALVAVLVGLVIGCLQSVTQVLAIRQLLEMVVPVVSLIGAWLITTPDPSGLGEENYGRSRKITRFVSVASFSIGILDKAIEVLPPSPLDDLLDIVSLPLFAVGYIAELIYLAKLAGRLSDPVRAERLAARCRSILWLSVGIVGLGVVAAVLFAGMAVGGGGMAAGAGLAAIVPCVMILGLLIVALGWLVLLLGFDRALRAEVERARSLRSSAAADQAGF